MLPEAVRHLAASLLHSYIEEGIPVHTVRTGKARHWQPPFKKGPMPWHASWKRSGLFRRRRRRGYRIALAPSSLQQARCECLEQNSSSPTSRQYLRHISDSALCLSCRINHTKLRLVLITLQTGRLSQSRCSLLDPSLTSSSKSWRRTRYRIPSGFQNLTSYMRTTAALSGPPR